MEREADVLKLEKEVWKNAYNDLHKQMAINEKKAEDSEVKIKELKETHASVVQWSARLATNPRARVRIPAWAVSAQPTQLVIHPFWVGR